MSGKKKLPNHWLTGRDIVEEELQGKKRAAYGAQLMKMMSKRKFNKEP